MNHNTNTLGKYDNIHRHQISKNNGTSLVKATRIMSNKYTCD